MSDIPVGAEITGRSNTTVGRVLGVQADGSVIVRTAKGDTKLLPKSAIKVKDGKVSTTWTDVRIDRAPAGKVPEADE